MPELRKDPVVGRWVIIATERARRPSDFVAQPVRPVGTECVFCAGNEHKTPPEILAGRSPGSRPNEPGWSYRVVANKFPALRIEGELEPAGDCRGWRLRRARAVRTALPLRDVDPSGGPSGRVRRVRRGRAARTRRAPERLPAPDEPRAPAPPVQLHAPHGAPARR